MTDAATLTEAIQRIERGQTGREVDCKVAIAVGWTVDKRGWWTDPSGRRRAEYGPPPITTSIDAAVAAVPPGMAPETWPVYARDGRQSWRVILTSYRTSPYRGGGDAVVHESWPTAICLTVLRAHLAMLEAA